MASMLKTVTPAVGIREDLSSLISRVEPEKTPFLSAIGTGTAKDVRKFWQNEELDAPSLDNKALEGFNADPVAAKPTTKVGSVAQLFHKTGSVSLTLEAADHAGVSSEIARSKINRGIAIKRDIEITYLSNQGSLLETGSTPRQTAGVLAWAKSNVDAGTGAVLDGGYQASGLVEDHSNVGALRALDVDQFNNVQQLMFAAGADTSTAMMGYKLKGKFSNNVAGNFETRGTVNGKDQATIYAGADVFVGEFGAVTIAPHPYALEHEVLFFDKNNLSDTVYRPFSTDTLAKTGDNLSYLMVTERMLEVKNEKSLGVIRQVQ